MSKIIINRSTEFSNKMRAIDIYLDDIKIGKIKDGQSEIFEVPAGAHKLKAQIDWCGSNEIEFTIQDGETLAFNLNGKNPALALYYITFGRNKYLVLKLAS